MSTLERLVCVVVGFAFGGFFGFYIHALMLPNGYDPTATGRAQGVWIACAVGGALWVNYGAKHYKPRPNGQPLPTLPSQRRPYRFGEDSHAAYLESIRNPRNDDGR